MGFDVKQHGRVQAPLIFLRAVGLRDSRFRTDRVGINNVFWLTDEQMARLRPFFPKGHGRPRVDDGRVSIGIIFSIAMGATRHRSRGRRIIAGSIEA